MDRGSWWFTIHGVTKEPDKIEYAYTHTHTHCALEALTMILKYKSTA